ncbi:MAG TPA: TrbI/VirB10 family protein [Polyangiales bacterium]|nr:TrbI/VirB10 family protein [Polyangiales bacterium]
MGLRPDTIAGDDAPRKRGTSALRPILIVAVTAVGMVSLALARGATMPESTPAAEQPRGGVLVPARDARDALRRRDGRSQEGASAGTSRATQEAPLPSTPPETVDASVRKSIVTAEGLPAATDHLGVTGVVPKLSLEGDVLAHAQLASPERTLLGKRLEEVLLERVVKTYEEDLERRHAGYRASAKVSAVSEARTQSAAEAATFLQGLGGDEGQQLEALTNQQRAAEQALQAAQSSSGGGLGGGAGRLAALLGGSAQGAPGEDVNQFAAKKQFFQAGGQDLAPGQLGAKVRKHSPYIIRMGWKIPGTLETAISSEGPGEITGLVSQDVYSASGKYLLIPQGSQLVGLYNAAVTQGQTRVQIAWVRVNMPNNTTLDLGSMPGADLAGVSGFKHTVNTHFWERLAGALIASMFTVGYEITAPMGRGAMENAVHRGVGESLTQFGVNEAQRAGQRPPTLEIPIGYQFNVMVHKDIVFDGPYDGRERAADVLDAAGGRRE